MKKILSILVLAALIVSLLYGCSNKKDDTSNKATPAASTPAPTADTETKPTEEATTIRIGGLTGATSIGMVKLMEDSENGKSENKYDFTIAGSADELTPKLIQGDLDIAAIPANLASVLYNNSNGAVKMLAVNTLGVLYVVTKGVDINQVSDLKGKTIYATAKGSVPEYVLRYILTSNGIDPDKDVKIEWKSEPTEVVSLMASEKTSIAMLPQPYVTVAAGQVEGLKTALDMTKEWNKLNNGSTLITGVLAVRSDFTNKYPEQLEAFLKEYRASTDYVNANVDDASKLVEKFGIFKAAVAAKAIPYCNITYMAGNDMKTAVNGYLKVLYDQNPKSVGGKLPGDDLYYAP